MGQTSRQRRWTQCLQTSVIISQRPPASGRRVNCSMNLTCRQLIAVEVPGVVVAVAAAAVRAAVVAGSSFHCLQATSQALQPMQTVVSVKNPIGSAGKAPSGVKAVPAAGSRPG